MAVWLDDAMENPLDALETMASDQLLALLEVVKAAETLHIVVEMAESTGEACLPDRVASLHMRDALARLEEFD